MGTCARCGADMQGEGTLCERCLEESDFIVPPQATWRRYVRPALVVGGALLLVGGAYVVVKVYKDGRTGSVDTDELLAKANTLLDSAHVAGAHSAEPAKAVVGSSIRLTQKVREQLLALNEGFTTTTHFKQRNFTEDRVYKIVNGQLHIWAKGKTSWADSRYAKDWAATAEETHRFLRNFRGVLKTDSIG